MPFYTLYLDCSGSPDWPRPWGNNPDNHFVMAGIALKPNQDHFAHQETQKLLFEYLGAPPGGAFELHYGDLINRRPPYDSLSGDQRKQMADEVFSMIKNIGPILFASVVNKVRMKERYGDRAYPVRSYAIIATIHRYAMTLQRLGALGSAVMDSEAYRIDKDLQAVIHKGRRFGMAIRGMNYQPQQDSHLEPVLNSLTFSPSEMSPGIQLADFVAYAVWSCFERGRCIRYNEIKHLFDHDGSSYYEPSSIPG